MSWKSWTTQIFLVCHLFLKTCFTAEFEISVPREPPVAILGQHVILDCSFPVGKAWDLDRTVITWQRGLEVIHSFYYGQDQLDRQSPHYDKRTSLYHSEIERGNASLRLERTNLGDSGDYTCFVSTMLGTQKKTFQLKVAAFYPEPRQNFTVSPSSLELLLTSQGGYPQPSVQWLDDRGDDVTSDIVTNISVDTLGLYSVFSTLTIQKPPNTTFTFVLKNKDLGQEIRREINLHFDKTGSDAVLPVVLQDRCRWLVFLPTCFTAEFEISVPREPPVAILGQHVILDCSFPVGKAWDLDRTVITWQRGLEVIHSFYYGRDQLDRQSPHYDKRTSLYHSEIERGNASLRLERTNLGDSGDYTCFVSTMLGTQKKTFQLKVAAFYPEPRQNFTVSPSSLELLLTSQGGYPQPSVQWLDDRGDDVTSDIVTNISVDTLGLYSVFSTLTIQKPPNTTFTFVLKNKDLGQEIRREINLHFDKTGKNEP
ncbi:hypothetical protein DPEC_G00315400 [Dallia pectoralis]|uniref:Uncharacterized protein n=1 Tax=Dallia pectoralis TaxID=75939 RepID=A0ACC2FCF1_DALPE|nr:hypothetical protein DPEC_G00315400 [Dallia pectoralis]